MPHEAGEAGRASGSGTDESGIVGGLTTDQMIDGCPFRAFCMIDDLTCECVCVEIDFSLPALRVLRTVDWLIESRGSWRRFDFLNASVAVVGGVRKRQILTQSVSLILSYFQHLPADSFVCIKISVGIENLSVVGVGIYSVKFAQVCVCITVS